MADPNRLGGESSTRNREALFNIFHGKIGGEREQHCKGILVGGRALKEEPSIVGLDLTINQEKAVLFKGGELFQFITKFARAIGTI